MFHAAQRVGLPPLELRTRANKEVFCSASYCACTGASGTDRRIGDASHRSSAAPLQQLAQSTARAGAAVEQQQIMPLVTWEPGVTADVAPDLLRAAPFVYVCDRLYNLNGQPGGFDIEERIAGRCHCKARDVLQGCRALVRAC